MLKKDRTDIIPKKKLKYLICNLTINYTELNLKIFSTNEIESFLARKTT